MKKIRKGFTLIELLIVITIMGILAVAVLSAINPIEQMKKARDAARKSDAAELLNAYERYFTTFGCYPWNMPAGGPCGTGNVPNATVVTAATFTTATGSLAGLNTDLITKEEMKAQYQKRNTVTNQELYVTEHATNHQVSVCFVPESKSGRSGGEGPMMDNTNVAAATGCAGAYVKTDATCSICVPQ